MQIEGERAWPIYKISVKWGIPIYAPEWIENNPDHHSIQGLPEGLQWNRTGTQIMFQKKLTSEEKNNELNRFLSILDKQELEKYNRELNWKYLKASIKFWHYEVWVLEWFSHKTFDIGQSDSEAVRSFSKFCDRVWKKNWEIYQETGNELDRDCGYDTLMGAEDRWRWTDNRDPKIGGDERSDPPCRCKWCKEQGVIRINH